MSARKTTASKAAGGGGGSSSGGQSVLSRFFSAAPGHGTNNVVTDAPPVAAAATATAAAVAPSSPPLLPLPLGTAKRRTAAKRKGAAPAAAAESIAVDDASAGIVASAPAPASTRAKRPRAAATAAASKLREVVSISSDDEAEGVAAAVAATAPPDAEEAEAESLEAPVKKRGKRAAATVAAPPASSFLASSAFSAPRRPIAAEADAAVAASSSALHPLFASAAAPTAGATAAAAAAPASPFRPRPLAQGEKLSLPSSFEAASDEAHRAYLDRLAATEFAAEISADPAQFNSYEQATVLGGAAASSAAAAAAAAASSSGAAAASAASSSSSGVGGGGGGGGFQTPAVFDLRSWSGVSTTTTLSKFTPLEQQVLALKRAHPDVLLLVEVGYKFRFFGRDAETAARLLDIYAHPSHHLLTASIPTFRCYIHVKRLVEAGLKVGVVRQTESATSKKMAVKGREKGAASNPLFARGISELYTKATSVPELDDEGEGALRSAVPARFLLCLHEESASSINAAALDSSAAVRTSLVAVDPTSGRAVWDSFDSGFLRAELETRLVALSPAEVLVSSDPAKLSANTARVLLSFADRASAAAGGGAAGEGVRLEKLDAKRYKFDYPSAAATVERFFAAPPAATATVKLEGGGGDERKEAVVHVLDDDAESSSSVVPSSSSSALLRSLNLPKGALICLGVLIPYLRSFGLESCLRLGAGDYGANLRPFVPAAAPMHLEGTTLHNLEVVRSQEGPVHGSLLWLLSHTKTAFGGRLLRQWVLAPLTDRAAIEARLDAVDELLSADSALGPLQPLLHQLPDLERGLARVQYGKCKPAEFMRLLDALRRVLYAFPAAEAVAQMRAPLLRALFGAVDVEAVRQKVETSHASLDARAVEAGRTEEFFAQPSLFPAVAAAKASIGSVEQELGAHLAAARRLLGPDYARLEFTAVNNVEFLVEVKVADVKRVPKTWVQINTTKVKTRFHPPEVASALDRLLLAREELTAASGEAWRSFLVEFGGHYALLRPLIDLLASLDCLSSLACVAALPGYVRPQFVDEPVLQIVGARHPMIEASCSLSGGAFVPNDIDMHAETGPRFSIVSGANMGGKSTYIRSIALCVILAQIGSFIPAESATLGVFDGVWTRMGARDSPAAGQSTLMVELSEASGILRQATSRSLVILDELGRGTSTSDGLAIAHATCRFILTSLRCCTLFVTHYPLLARLQHDHPRLVRTFHMSYVEEPVPAGAKTDADGEGEGGEGGGDVAIPAVTFLYKLAPGMAPSSFGLNVARMAHVPAEVLRRAAVKAQEMRNRSQADKERRAQTLRLDAFQRLKALLAAPASASDDIRSDVKRIIELATPAASS